MKKNGVELNREELVLARKKPAWKSLWRGKNGVEVVGVEKTARNSLDLVKLRFLKLYKRL